VLVEELMPFDEALVDAIVAEKPFVITSWVEVKICFIYYLFHCNAKFCHLVHPNITEEPDLENRK